MLTSETRAVVLEALECLRHNAGHHEYIGNNTHQYMPDVAKRATIDAAIAEVNAEAEWVPVADGEYGECDTIKLKHNGSFVTIHSAYGSGSSRLTAMMPLPDNVRLCQRIGSQSAVQDG